MFTGNPRLPVSGVLSPRSLLATPRTGVSEH